MGRVYLDYAASAPLRPVARAAMLAALDGVGNASSIHAEGQRARALVDDARRTLADFLNVRAERVVFTSGGTEANNLALRGVMAKAPGKRVLASAVEHDCVLRTAEVLGGSLIAVDANGVVKLDALEAELKRGDVALVSVMHANNENGVLQPVREIAALAKRHGALVHTDAVQSVGHVPVSVDELGVDLLSCAAHKLGGPQGVGALVVKPDLAMLAQLTGGGQERNRRAGTENVSGIAGFGAAVAAAAADFDAERARIAALAAAFEAGVAGRFTVVGGAEKVPHIRQILVSGAAEDTVIKLDMHGIAVSQGSACGSGRVAESHVVRAMGLSGGAVRFSWGWASTEADMAAAVKAL